MNVEQQLVTELGRRVRLLEEETKVWDRLVASPASGMGIHRSQVEAVQALYRGFQRKVQGRLDDLSSSQGTPEFSARLVKLEQDLVSTHGVMAVFRMILGQRADRRFFRDALDLADYVAWDCYMSCVDRAVEWGAITRDERRVPPLTYLNTMYSPAAITRTGTFGAFKMPVDGNLNLRLPIGVVSLPFHHTEAVWTFCSLYHEVGHLLDTDFKLRHALRTPLEARLEHSGTRRAYWSDRLGELTADAVGVLLGGEGYARLLVKLLLLPPHTVTTLDPSDGHPNHYLRVFLLGALLRETRNAQLAAVASSLEALWRRRYGNPVELAPYVDESEVVAEVLLRHSIGTLGGRSISEFVPQEVIADDQAKVVELSRYLRLGVVEPPHEQDGRPFPVRLVPAASQVATGRAEGDAAAAFAAIHSRALGFVDTLRAKLPTFLGPEDLTDPRRRFLEALVDDIQLDEDDAA